jgi:hypothetical protein
MDGGDFNLIVKELTAKRAKSAKKPQRFFLAIFAVLAVQKRSNMLLEATTTQTIIREISADLETPVSVYLKLRGDGASFLLESVEGGERIARYSFIGVQPKAQYIMRDTDIEIKDEVRSRT